ncbi:hypothetical protein H0A65_15270 [Alcaligenaceae bacterium]|nr:hypothetical protein [Alcaligenaceae bacterium]
MSAITSPNERLFKAEVEASLQGLSPADWKRAESIAKLLCGGVIGWASGDLLQEALCRLLDGTRVWPVDLHPLVVLKGVMHSIASNARKHNDVSPIDQHVVVDAFETDEDARTPIAHGEVTVTPEDELSGKQQLAELYAALGGDEELELLVMAWAEGERGAEARETLGWDEKRYDAARNRLLRRLNALDTEWRST